MRYRDPETGHFISEADYFAKYPEELPEPDYPDDYEYDWDYEFEEGEYEG